MSKNYMIVEAPDGRDSALYSLTKKAVKAVNIKKSLIGTKEEVLTRAAKNERKEPSFHYADRQ